MRSLDADDFRGPRLVWFFAALLLAAWTGWFFTAQIPDPAGERRAGGQEIQRIVPARLAWRALRSTLDRTVPKDPGKQ